MPRLGKLQFAPIGKACTTRCSSHLHRKVTTRESRYHTARGLGTNGSGVTITAQTFVSIRNPAWDIPHVVGNHLLSSHDSSPAQERISRCTAAHQLRNISHITWQLTSSRIDPTLHRNCQLGTSPAREQTPRCIRTTYLVPHQLGTNLMLHGSPPTMDRSHAAWEPPAWHSIARERPTAREALLEMSRTPLPKTPLLGKT